MKKSKPLKRANPISPLFIDNKGERNTWINLLKRSTTEKKGTS